jgi:hypothetical protein
MALLKNSPSPEQQTREIIEGNLRAMYATINSMATNVKQVIWHNPFGLTSEQVFTLLDTDAAALEGLLKPAIDLYNSVQADAKLVDAPAQAITRWDERAVVVGEDGKVAIAKG